MQWCSKLELEITGCSRQVSLFTEERCRQCVEGIEKKPHTIDPRKAEAVSLWRDRLGILPGMSRHEALEKFRAWREDKATCRRCEEKDYTKFCPVATVCRQANEEEVSENGRSAIVGKEPTGNIRAEESGLGLNEATGPQVGQGI